LVIVLALAGDSTMTNGRPPAAVASEEVVLMSFGSVSHGVRASNVSP